MLLRIPFSSGLPPPVEGDRDRNSSRGVRYYAPDKLFSEPEKLSEEYSVQAFFPFACQTRFHLQKQIVSAAITSCRSVFSVCLSVSLSGRLAVCLSVFLPVGLPVCLSVALTPSLPRSLSPFPSLSLSLSYFALSLSLALTNHTSCMTASRCLPHARNGLPPLGALLLAAQFA
jgi:hypothetical protein